MRPHPQHLRHRTQRWGGRGDKIQGSLDSARKSAFLIDEGCKFTFIMLSNMTGVFVMLFYGSHAWFSKEVARGGEEGFVLQPLGREASRPGLPGWLWLQPDSLLSYPECRRCPLRGHGRIQPKFCTPWGQALDKTTCPYVYPTETEPQGLF